MTWHDFWDLLQNSMGVKDTGEIQIKQDNHQCWMLGILMFVTPFCFLQFMHWVSPMLPYMLWVTLAVVVGVLGAVPGLICTMHLSCHRNIYRNLGCHSLPEQIWKCKKVNTPWDNSLLMWDKTCWTILGGILHGDRRVPCGTPSVINLITCPWWIFPSSLLPFLWTLSSVP